MQIMRVFAQPVQQITGSSNSSHWQCMRFVVNPSASFLESVRGGQYAAARDLEQEIPPILHLLCVKWSCAAAADTRRDYGAVLGLRQDAAFLHGQCTSVQQPPTACHNCSTTQTRLLPNSGTG